VLYYGGGGLVLLLTSPENRMKWVGVLLETMAALCFLLVFSIERRNRKPPKVMAPPEPYTDLQASMARLHEAEDKEHYR
jgi:hypothetical protein